MRKLTSLIAFFALVLFAVQAQAVKLGIYDRGALVPSVVHDGGNLDTVVGITCQLQCSRTSTDSLVGDHNATAKRVIHWTFFDVDSHHVTDGQFPCTDDDLYGFSWKANAGRGLENVEGYLVFRSTSSDMRIAANAFLVDMANKDAIFIPVVPLDTDDMATDGTDAVLKLTNGIQGKTRVDMRYWIDPTYNAATTIVIWLVDPILNSNHKPITQTVLAWNDDEQVKSVNIDLPHELNKIIPCQIPGLPTEFVDGFITWITPASNDSMIYSYISSSLFGAQQTLLAAQQCTANATIGGSIPSCGCTGAGR